MTKMKKAILSVLSLGLVATVSIGGTLAFFSDRDSEVNTFTVGDVTIDLEENFTQGSELLPGVKIEKEAYITNTGDNEAYVWMTLAVPAALDSSEELGVGNILHWNVPGCFWNGYHNQDKFIQSGIKDGYLPEGSAGVADEDSWINKNESVQETIGGVVYNVYTFKYVGAIEPGETTNIALSQVYIDAAVDVNTDGQWYKVVNGEAKKIEWNDSMGAPKVLVSAYGIQADGFADVEAAYKAYQTQWGDNGTEYGGIIVNNADELRDALENNTNVTIILNNDIEIDKVNLTNPSVGNVVILADNHTISVSDSDAGVRSVQIAGENRKITIVDANIVCNDVTTEKNADVRGVSFNKNSSGSTVNLIDCTIDLTAGEYSYGVNLTSGNTGVTLNIDGCFIRASQPVKIFNSDSVFNFSNSTFVCTSSHPFSEKEWYAQCIRLQDNAKNNIVNVSNCKFDYQGSDSEEREVYGIVDTGTGNTVNVSNCTYGSDIDIEYKKDN